MLRSQSLSLISRHTFHFPTTGASPGQVLQRVRLVASFPEPLRDDPKNAGIDIRPRARLNKPRQVFGIRGCDQRRTSKAESLGRKQHIGVLRTGFRRGSPLLSGASPQFRCKAKGLISQWDVPARSSIHEHVQTAYPDNLIRPEQSRLIS